MHQRYFRLNRSNISLKLLTVSCIPSFGFRVSLLIMDETRETTSAHLLHFPPQTRKYPTSFVRNVQPTLPAVRQPLSHAQTLEGRVNQAVSAEYRAIDTKGLDSLLLKYTESPDGQRPQIGHGIQHEPRPDELEKEY